MVTVPLCRPTQLGDIPAPDLIGMRGQEFGYGIGGVAELVPPLPDLASLGEDALHSALRAEVAALIEQRGIDLSRGRVHEAIAI